MEEIATAGNGDNRRSRSRSGSPSPATKRNRSRSPRDSRSKSRSKEPANSPHKMFDKEKGMRDLHKLDMKILQYNDNLPVNYHMPECFVRQVLGDYFWELAKASKQSVVIAGSQSEGALSCRMLKNMASRGEMDRLMIYETFTEADRGTKFTALEKGTARYKVDHDLISFDVNQLKQLGHDVQHYRSGLAPAGEQSTNVINQNSPAIGIDSYHYKPDGSYVYTSADTVIAIQLDFWPPEAKNWLTRPGRKWPEQDIITAISKKPALLVHKPSSDDSGRNNEWYLSFTFAEKILCRKRTEEMQVAYFIFKTIFYCCFNFEVKGKEFGSYLAKTTMLWMTEEMEPSDWIPERMEDNVKHLFKRLLDGLKKRHIPHYFIPEMNLLNELPDELFDEMDKRVNQEKLLESPLSLLPDNIPQVTEHLEECLRCGAIEEEIANEIRRKTRWEKGDCAETYSLSDIRHTFIFKNLCRSFIIDNILKPNYGVDSSASQIVDKVRDKIDVNFVREAVLESYTPIILWLLVIVWERWRFISS